MRKIATLAAAIGLAAALAGCGSSNYQDTPGEPPTTSPATTAPANTYGNGNALIATAKDHQANVYATATSTTVAKTVKAPNLTTPLVFLVVARNAAAHRWQVLLPTGKNSATGWINAEDVTTAHTAYWLEIRLRTRQLLLHKGDAVLLHVTVAVGKPSTPTPPGRYFITELLQPPNPRGAYGPYAYGLSGLSPSLKNWTGEPRLGIHGTNQPGLLGRPVSHGCIRVANPVITRLARLLPLGTPVQIVGAA